MGKVQDPTPAVSRGDTSLPLPRSDGLKRPFVRSLSQTKGQLQVAGLGGETDRNPALSRLLQDRNILIPCGNHSEYRSLGRGDLLSHTLSRAVSALWGLP